MKKILKIKTNIVTCDFVTLKKSFRNLMPLHILLWSLSIFAIGLFLIPAQTNITFSIEALIYFGSTYLAAILGLLISFQNKINLNRIRNNGKLFSWNIAAKRCIYLSSIGVFIAIVDRYVIRGVSLTAGIFEARSSLEDVGAGWLSIMAAFFSSFAAFGLIVVWLARSLGQSISRTYQYIAIANLVTYLALSVALGSRSLFLVCAMLHLFAYIFLKRIQGQRFGIKSISWILFALLSITILLAVIMLERLDQMGLPPMVSIQLSAYSYTLTPTPLAYEFLSRNEFLQSFGAAVYSLIIYFFHGFYEMLLLVDKYNGEYTYGEQLLWMPLKLIGVFMPLPLATDLEQFSGYRAGIFTTFAGPFFIDFGMFAPIFIAMIFAILGLPYKFLVNGDLRWFIANIQVCVIIVFTPIMALLQSSVGTYLLIAAVFLVILIPKQKLYVEQK